MYALFLALSGCSLKDRPADDTTDGDGGAYPSGFSSGKYRVSSFTILGTGEGNDWDSDGTPDNNLPVVLATFDLLLAGWDVSKTGLNLLVADAIGNDSLVLLVDARYVDDELTLDFLAGTADGDGTYSVDEAQSYDANGDPISRLEGTFVGATSYETGPDPMVLSIPVDTSGTAAPFPAEEVLVDGDLGAITLEGTIVGIVPVDRLVAAVLPIFIPSEGFDLNDDGGIDPHTESQAAITSLVTTLVGTGADVETEDGEPGISAAFDFVAGATNF